MTKLTRIFIVLCAACVCPVAAGALGLTTDSGTDPGYWDTHCIVICKITAVNLKDLPISSAQVDVIAVAFTSFVMPTTGLKIGFHAHGDGSVSLDDVAVGTIVCACVQHVDDRWEFSPNLVAFMFTENEGPIQRVSGIDDPKISLILKAVRKVRRESDGKADK